MLELIGSVTLMTMLCGLFLISRFKRCPANKIMIVSGKTGGDDKVKIYTSGGVFVWPILQDYAFLDRIPLKVWVGVMDAMDNGGHPFTISGEFVVAIGDSTSLIRTAVKRLLTLKSDQITNLCEEMIRAELHLVVSALSSVELNDRNQLIDAIYVGVKKQLNQIGLQLLNVDLDQLLVNKSTAHNTSTEELRVPQRTLELPLKPDQVDALLKGEDVYLQLPFDGRIARLFTPTTN